MPPDLAQNSCCPDCGQALVFCSCLLLPQPQNTPTRQSGNSQGLPDSPFPPTLPSFTPPVTPSIDPRHYYQYSIPFSSFSPNPAFPPFQSQYINLTHLPQLPNPIISPQPPPTSNTSDRIFNDETQQTINRANAQGRKRTGNQGGRGRNKAQKSNNPSSDAPTTTAQATSTQVSGGPAVAGVGPIREDENSIPRAFSEGTHFGSLVRGARTYDGAQSNSATHVWHFVRRLKTPEPLPSIPENKEFLKCHPKQAEWPVLQCRLCTSFQWWTNQEGVSSTIARHMRKVHGPDWIREVIKLGLKNADRFASQSLIDDDDLEEELEVFTLKGFLERLARWIVVDDQSINVVECKELRDLLVYIGRPNLKDKDIPHRTELGNIIVEQFNIQYRAMIERISNSLGRVSFTSDMWSRVNMTSHLAVTAHYLARDRAGDNVVLRSELVAFRAVHGSHDGPTIAGIIMDVIKDIGCLNKIGMITLDNASNNNTLMTAVAQELQGFNIHFDPEGNRIRCFPHVVNIAVQTALKYLSRSFDRSFDPDTLEPVDQQPSAELLGDKDYLKALEDDIIATARSLVAVCRSSGQRREKLRNVIKEGNKAGGFGNPPEMLAELELLRDVDTRWSSVFLMIDRLLDLYAAVAKFIHTELPDESEKLLSPVQLEVLEDVRTFLFYVHSVQESVSAEKTPTLSVVLPLYEQLIAYLEDLKIDHPKIRHAIQAAILKLKEYLVKSRTAKVYALAIVLNPTIKFEWLKEHWTEEEYAEARRNVRKAMFEFQQESCRQRPIAPLPSRTPSSVSRSFSLPASTIAAQNIASGRAKLARFHSSRELRKASLTPMATGTGSTETSPASPTAPTLAELAAQQEQEDWAAVDRELARYEAAGIKDTTNFEEMKDFNILRYWQENQNNFPLLWKIALDVLPAQASAVPCERVFSSSKETDSLRRQSMKETMMEILQILKYIFRCDCLSFTENILSDPKVLAQRNDDDDRLHAEQNLLQPASQINDLVTLVHTTSSLLATA